VIDEFVSIEHWWSDTAGEERRIQTNTGPSANLSTKNPTYVWGGRLVNCPRSPPPHTPHSTQQYKMICHLLRGLKDKCWYFVIYWLNAGNLWHSFSLSPTCAGVRTVTAAWQEGMPVHITHAVPFKYTYSITTSMVTM
jgi:hypothetical protein